MRLLKCSDCNQEISITSDKCPYCGSQKQFKNYIFMRKELSKEGITPMEMMNFQRRGGKIKIIHWGKWFKYGGIAFVLLFIVGAILGNQKVEYTKPDGTIVEITQFELNKINEAKRDKEKEKDLLLELGKTEKYNYKKLQDIYSSLSDLRKDNKEYVEKLKYYELANKSSSQCLRLVHETDRSRLSFPDSFDIKIDGKEAGFWSDDKEYLYQYSFGFKNAFGMEKVLLSRYYCYYDDNFNLIKIQRDK